VAQQPRLDVLGSERLAQERVVQQVNLADREVVGGAPVRIDVLDVLLSQSVPHVDTSIATAGLM
jgi:hypothetical protein